MNRLAAAVLTSAVSLAVLAGPGSLAHAQLAVPAGQSPSQFKDTSFFKPPVGAKVAILEFEDLECPACAHAFPIVHTAMKQYNIPLVRHDFPLHMHIWSRDAALYARYLQDKVSPDVATDYRRQVFASQYQIASKDDLKNFTQRFFSQHGQQMPFVVDPSGALSKEIDADYALGERMGLVETPTIVVVTNNGWIQVKDVGELYHAIDEANAMAAKAAPAPVVKHTAAKK